MTAATICEVCGRQEARWISEEVGIQPLDGCWRKYEEGSYEADGPAAQCYRLGYERQIAEVLQLRQRRALHADWLIDQLCKAAELELRADARVLVKERIEKALNPELAL